MVTGLRLFTGRLDGFVDQYALIGGAACDTWLADRALPFRSTKDLDVVLLVDDLVPAFVERLWAFIKDGEYQSLAETEKRPRFYRFSSPRKSDYPRMIELLTRNLLNLPKGVTLTPIPVGDEVSSLSAILMEEEYYRLVVGSRMVVDGTPIVSAGGLIPLKVRAWLDLTARREAGDRNVKGDDIRKHRNDVFRLLRSLAPAERFELPERPRTDLRAFIGRLPAESAEWESIRKAVGPPALPAPEALRARLREAFGLGEG